MAEPATLLTVATPQLQAGDIVYAYGMRVRLDTLRTSHGGFLSHRTGKCSQGHAGEFGEACSVVYAWHGTVLNVGQVLTADPQLVPRHFLFDEERHVHGAGHGREDSWTVQGNYLARWHVERAG